MFCNGGTLPINQNQALFSLLGTTFGGDGRVNFGLPDLRGRVPIHVGNGHVQGEKAGEVSHTLTQQEYPAIVFGADSILGYFDLIRADQQNVESFIEAMETMKAPKVETTEDIEVWSSERAKQKAEAIKG